MHGKDGAECGKALRRYRREQELKPFQVELLKLQGYLEDHNRPMLILFEGRDAAGKGGTIRRITHYMNQKHYRVVALGRPTETQPGAAPPTSITTSCGVSSGSRRTSSAMARSW